MVTPEIAAEPTFETLRARECCTAHQIAGASRSIRAVVRLFEVSAARAAVIAEERYPSRSSVLAPSSPPVSRSGVNIAPAAAGSSLRAEPKIHALPSSRPRPKEPLPGAAHASCGWPARNAPARRWGALAGAAGAALAAAGCGFPCWVQGVAAGRSIDR
jgi:hypothetical protein